MKIQKLVDFLTSEDIVVVVPDEMEKRILTHRLMCSGFKNFKLIDDNTISFNGTILKILTVIEANKANFMTRNCLIEFPEMIPDNMLVNLHKNFNNFILTNEIN